MVEIVNAQSILLRPRVSEHYENTHWRKVGKIRYNRNKKIGNCKYGGELFQGSYITNQNAFACDICRIQLGQLSQNASLQEALSLEY